MYLQSSLSALLFLPWDEVNHARHQMKSKREKESNLRSTRAARNFTHVVFRCLFAPASSFRTNSFLVTYLLCGREFWFPTRQNLTESGSVIAPLRATRGKLTCAAFFGSSQLAIQRSAPHRTAILDIANCGCSCIGRKLEVQGCTEGFTRDERLYKIQEIWYWLRYLFLAFFFLFSCTYKSTNSQQRLQSIYQFG